MVLLCSFWGVQQVASKVALSQGIPPLLQAVLRSALASAALVLWVGSRRGRAGLRTLFARDDTLWPGAAIALLFAAEFICLFYGVRLTSASRSVVLLFSGAFFTALGAHVFLPGERLQPVNWAGLVLAFLGVAATMGGGAGSLRGDVLVLVAAANWGFTTVVVRANPSLAAAPAGKVLGYQVIGSLPLLLLTAGLGGDLRVPSATALAWASVLFQGVVIVFATYLAWFWLIARYPAGQVAAFSLLTPLLGVVAAGVLLGEPLTPMLFLGLALVVAGLRLVNRN